MSLASAMWPAANPHTTSSSSEDSQLKASPDKIAIFIPRCHLKQALLLNKENDDVTVIQIWKDGDRDRYWRN